MKNLSLYETVKKFLQNRKYVYTRIVADPKKQQIIIDAENRLHYLKQSKTEAFKIICKRYATDFIAPLIPNEKSKMHHHANDIYNQLINQ